MQRNLRNGGRVRMQIWRKEGLKKLKGASQRVPSGIPQPNPTIYFSTFFLSFLTHPSWPLADHRCRRLPRPNTLVMFDQKRVKPQQPSKSWPRCGGGSTAECGSLPLLPGVQMSFSYHSHQWFLVPNCSSQLLL